ncbi:MAG: DUF167 domain-containing protein [Phycisphaeraceae bacterium]|nr:DUF167 domain-containing protein [Phycisphaeraceae bacterium]
MTGPATPLVQIQVKAVPGSSRDQIVGRLGGALKIKVVAPAEAGKANRAICRLIAESLGLNRQAVELLSGHGQPNKRIAIRGVDAGTIRRKLFDKA